MNCQGGMLVFERTSLWAPALRMACRGELPIVETRSLDDCRRVLPECPDCFQVLAVAQQDLDEVVSHLLAINGRWRRACAAAVVDRSLRQCRWLLREAGAVHVASSAADLMRLGRIARRHWRQVHRAADAAGSQPPAIRDRLPWRPLEK
jgi:hypothetical protein